ncbi:phage baseplate assembly protein V [Solimonas flava]|uniref:phage baseplate assembly protein V n=1 Tax=Solimonas flava TaxID=415849 RepID=UPI000416E5FB|nr:phage baseplate assembly protein V [Solimonas flava]
MDARRVSQFVERLVRQLVSPIGRQVSMLATRVRIAAVNDATKIQTVQLTGRAVDGKRPETLDGVQRLQQFGFSSVPLPGSDGLMICIGGSRSNPVVIVCDDGSKRVVGMEPGETVVYNAFGDYVKLLKTGEMVVKAREKVTVDSPLTHALGDAEVDGDALVHGDAQVEGNAVVLGNLHVAGAITADGAISSATSISDPFGTMQGMRVVYNGHTQAVSSGVAHAPNEQM